MEVRGANPALIFPAEYGIAAVVRRPGWVLEVFPSPGNAAWAMPCNVQCSWGAEEGPGQADGEKGSFPRAGLTAVDLLPVSPAEQQEWKRSTGSCSCIARCVGESE